MRLVALGAAILGSLLTVGAALAVPISPSPTITFGPITADTFGAVITQSGTGGGGPTLITNIDVSAVDSTTLRFTSGFSAFSDFDEDVLISYHVTSTQPITAIDLSFNGSVLFGMAVTSVVERVHSGSPAGPIVGMMTVSCSFLGSCDFQDPAYELSDIPLSWAFTELWIDKDTNLTALLNAAMVDSVIDQGFHTNVPEPASLAVLGSGMLALGIIRRRRQGD